MNVAINFGGSCLGGFTRTRARVCGPGPGPGHFENPQKRKPTTIMAHLLVNHTYTNKAFGGFLDFLVFLLI